LFAFTVWMTSMVTAATGLSRAWLRSLTCVARVGFEPFGVSSWPAEVPGRCMMTATPTAGEPEHLGYVLRAATQLHDCPGIPSARRRSRAAGLQIRPFGMSVWPGEGRVTGCRRTCFSVASRPSACDGRPAADRNRRVGTPSDRRVRHAPVCRWSQLCGQGGIRREHLRRCPYRGGRQARVCGR
jgi:hypothetical protein